MCQIASHTSKLQLLQKAREIEEDEEDRLHRKKMSASNPPIVEPHSYNIEKKCLDKLICNEYNMKTILSLLKEIKDDMKELTYHRKMDSVDLSVFFPVDSDEDLNNFLNRDHEDWAARRKAFYHLMFTTVNNSKDKFACALLHSLFTRNYISTHQWPG